MGAWDKMADGWLSSPVCGTVAATSEQKKLQKRQRRKRVLLLKSEPHLAACLRDKPTHRVLVSNGGLKNGLSDQFLKTLFSCEHTGEVPPVEAVHMPPEKDFAVVSFRSEKAAAMAVERLNGACVQEMARDMELLSLLSPVVVRGPPLHLFLFFVDNLPIGWLSNREKDMPLGSPSKEELMAVPRTPVCLPRGLVLLQDYLSLDEEAQLLKALSSTQSELVLQATPTEAIETSHPRPIRGNTSFAAPSRPCTSTDLEQRPRLGSPASMAGFEPPSTTLRHRTVTHYGYEFLYGSSTVDPDTPLPGGLPDCCLPVLHRLVTDGAISKLPDQLTINEYHPGAGIPPHIDTHSAFEDGIVSVTLGSQAVMEFRHPSGDKVPVLLQRRSVLVMAQESRYLWTHGIPSRKTDVVYPNMPGRQGQLQPMLWCHSERPSTSNPDSESAMVLERGTRVSLTFRKVRRLPCNCGYPLQCDSQQQTAPTASH